MKGPTLPFRHEQRRRLAALRAFPVLEGCSREELRRLDSLGTVIRRPAGHLLVVEGMVGRECLVVMDGSVAISRRGEVLSVLGPGSLVGELALLSGAPRSATIMALSDVEVVVLDPREFSELMAVPPVRAAIERAVLERGHAARAA